MIEIPKSKAAAARDEQTAKAELTSALRPLRLLVAASIILPVAIFLAASWVSYHQHLAESRDRVQRNLNTIYEHALKVFETFELSARYLDELADGVSEAEFRRRESEFNLRLRSLTEALPQLRDLWIIAPSGAPIVSGTVYPMPKLDLSDREYFRVQKENPAAGTYVSEVLKARAADTTFFTLSRRISRASLSAVSPPFRSHRNISSSSTRSFRPPASLPSSAKMAQSLRGTRTCRSACSACPRIRR